MDVERYEEWLLALGLEDSTVLNYRGKTAKARGIAAEQGWELDRLTASQTQWVAGHFPQTRSTLGQLKGALTHYVEMCDGTTPVRAIRLPKRVGPDDEYLGLEDDEADRLEATAFMAGPAGLAALMGLYLALRRTEMATLRWECFDSRLEGVEVLGKGRRMRWLPIHPTLRDVLEPADGWVFPGTGRSGHVHAGTIYNWIGELGGIADVDPERRNPHALRHTCLTRLYEETGDVRLVQRFAGHADPATTAKYTRVPRRLLIEGVSTLHYGTAA